MRQTSRDIQFSLLNLPVPLLLTNQLEKFTFDSIFARDKGSFDPNEAKKVLVQSAGRKVIAIDMGGGTFRYTIFKIDKGGNMIPLEEKIIYGKYGKGFLELLEKISKKATKEHLHVGISTAGSGLEGTKLMSSRNMRTLISDLKEKYSSDFKNIFHKLKVVLLNDAVAGLIGSSCFATEKYPETKTVMFEINGTGYGQAVLTNSKIFATEVGHVEIVSELNPFNQDEPCGSLGNNFTCIERVAASGAGIEAIWQKQTDENLDGKEISKRYQEGDHLAKQLYDNSARLMAHGIIGTANVLNLFKNAKSLEQTTIVLHGGCSKVPFYPERLKQILEKNLKKEIKLIVFKEGKNPSLEGAAIASLIKY